MEIKYFKSCARLTDRDQVNKGGLDLSKEVLWVSVGQWVADLRAVKVGGWKKIQVGRPRHIGFETGREAEFFFTPPTLTAGSSAPL